MRRQNSEEALRSLEHDDSPRASGGGLRSFASAPNLQLYPSGPRQSSHDKSLRSIMAKDSPDYGPERRTSGPSDDDEHSASDTVVASSEASGGETQTSGMINIRTKEPRITDKGDYNTPEETYCRLLLMLVSCVQKPSSRPSRAML